MIPKHVPEIDGVRIEQVKQSVDKRGSFIKFHPVVEFESNLDSVALSFNPQSGTIRGLHFQVEPFAEEKLITCLWGSMFEVIADLRPDSPTFGKWSSFELSADNRLQAYLPKGIAHGFQTLVPDSIIHYCLSSSYSPEFSYTINPFSSMRIDWPLEPKSVSERDAGGLELSVAAEIYAKSLKD